MKIANPNSPARGYLFVITAALLWGISGSSAKFLFRSGVTPLELVQLRITLAASCLFVWLIIKNPKSLKISAKDLVYFFILGTIGMALVQFTYLYAISKINVAAAILLQYLAPAFIALYSVVFVKEKLKPKTLVSLIGAIAGCYLVVGAYNLNILSMNWLGIASGLLSAVCFAWYSLHGEYGMRTYKPWTVLFYAFLFAAMTWNTVLSPLSAFGKTYTPIEWGWIFYIGILGTLVPFGLYLEGVNLIRSTHACITATLEPITAGIISFIFLKETMAPFQILGAVLVLGSITLLQLNREMDEKAPGLIRESKKA